MSHVGEGRVNRNGEAHILLARLWPFMSNINAPWCGHLFPSHTHKRVPYGIILSLNHVHVLKIFINMCPPICVVDKHCSKLWYHKGRGHSKENPCIVVTQNNVSECHGTQCELKESRYTTVLTHAVYINGLDSAKLQE